MTSIALVLGAGGAVGHGFHAAVLAALGDLTGWDARCAELVVGTSAGSAVAAALRAGLAPDDLAHRAAGRPLSPAGEALLAGVGAPVSPLGAGPHRHRGVASLRPAAPALLAGAVLPPWRTRPGVLLAGMAPSGRITTEPLAERARAVTRRQWPEAPTWICAVRLDDGRRVVFGRDPDPVADLGDAVAASCAVPGVFEPRRIDGQRFVDGGAHSPTNADLVAGLGFDLVVVSSPMSATVAGVMTAPDPVPRLWHRHTLEAEVAGVRRAGTPVLVIEPGPAELRTMGRSLAPAALRPEAAGDTVRLVEVTMRHRLAAAGEAVADALDLLRAAARPDGPPGGAAR